MIKLIIEIFLIQYLIGMVICRSLLRYEIKKKIRLNERVTELDREIFPMLIPIFNWIVILVYFFGHIFKYFIQTRFWKVFLNKDI